MIANLLLTFYRVTARHPRYALLNLGGLSLGIAVFLTLGLFVRFETSFDDFIPNADKIYAVGTRWDVPGRGEQTFEYSMAGMLDVLHEDFPDLVGTRLWDHRLTVHSNGESTLEQEEAVDPDFFKVFDLPLVQGDKANALQPGKMMLTEAMARKYFGRTDVIGDTLRVNEEEGERSYVISAILKDIPHNTERKFDFIRLITPDLVAARGANYRNFGSTSLNTYVRFDDPAQAAALGSQLDDFVDRKGGTVNGGQKRTTIMTLRLLPFLGLHLRDPKAMTSVLTLGLVGILSFGIAAINFINLATARAGMRAREVAVRRTLGATQTGLRVQFLGEALLMTLLSLIGGLSLVELTLPVINAAGGTDLALHYGPFLFSMLGAVLAMGLLSGIYPAFVLAAFQPAQILASSRSPSGGKLGMRVREALVVLQFAAVIAFFVMTTGFMRQLDHMRSSDLGFRREGLFVVPSTYDWAVTPPMLHSILAAFRATPGVTAVTVSDGAPGDDNESDWDRVWRPGSEDKGTDMQHSIVGPDFFKTYGANLLAGRLVDMSHPGDKTASPGSLDDRNIVINLRAVREYGFASAQDAIDQTLMTASPRGQTKLHIIGVVDDIRFRNPKDGRPPEYFFLMEEPSQQMVTGIRYEGVPQEEMRSRIQEAWRKVAPEVPLEIISANDNLAKYYKPDDNRSHLFLIGALVAAAVGCIGLYGMAAFSTSRRMLEVAVRKVLGASRGSIVKLLVGQFMRPVLLANVIAWPIGYVALSNWLSQFDDHVPVGFVTFIAAGGAAMAVAVVTVAALAFASANAEPGKALRSE